MNYLASFNPLVKTAAGKEALKKDGLPPFIDGSIRREPDFESEFPSITALCRGSIFAPKLNLGDLIIYITTKGSYLDEKKPHWRLVGVLKILQKLDTHDVAAVWYRSRDLPIPSNCVVVGNPAIDLDKSMHPNRSHSRWDAVYRMRAKRYPTFLISAAKYLELYHPASIHENMMIDVFGRIPGTQNPPKINNRELVELVSVLGINMNLT